MVAMIVCTLSSCEPIECNKEGHYHFFTHDPERTSCAQYDGNYGEDFESALDSLIRTYYVHIDLSKYRNYYFTVDTLQFIDHPDNQNRDFLYTVLFQDGFDDVITGHIYDGMYYGGGSSVFDWIIDTKGDVYYWIPLPD